jgi:hypothetical protein
MHWELAIDTEHGTMSEASFDELKDALLALRNHDNPTSFIDLWDESRHLGQTVSKKDLKQKN